MKLYDIVTLFRYLVADLDTIKRIVLFYGEDSKLIASRAILNKSKILKGKSSTISIWHNIKNNSFSYETDLLERISNLKQLDKFKYSIVAINNDKMWKNAHLEYWEFNRLLKREDLKLTMQKFEILKKYFPFSNCKKIFENKYYVYSDLSLSAAIIGEGTSYEEALANAFINLSSTFASSKKEIKYNEIKR